MHARILVIVLSVLALLLAPTLAVTFDGVDPDTMPKIGGISTDFIKNVKTWVFRDQKKNTRVEVYRKAEQKKEYRLLSKENRLLATATVSVSGDNPVNMKDVPWIEQPGVVRADAVVNKPLVGGQQPSYPPSGARYNIPDTVPRAGTDKMKGTSAFAWN